MLLVSLSFLLLIFSNVYTANPENATCSPTSIISDLITIDCLIYPSCRIEDIGLRINNNTYSSSTDDKQLQIVCRSEAPWNGQLYYTTKCSIGINLKILTPGDNQISVTVTTHDNGKNFNISSNDLIISLFDYLQVPTCSQPNIKDDGQLITMDCLTQLYYNNISCSLRKRTDGYFTRTVATVDGERILHSNETFAVRCHFKIMPSVLGDGRHELMVTLSSTNSTGDFISKSTNWTDHLNFFLPKEMNFTVNGNSEGAVVNIGDNVNLYCIANGFPAPSLDIQRDEPALSGFSIHFIQNYTYSFTAVVEVLVFITAAIADVWATQGTQSTKKFFLNIKCPLRSMLDSFLDSPSRYLGKFFNTSSLNFDVFGYPGPQSMTIFKPHYPDNTLSTDSVKTTYTQGYGPHGSIEIKFINTELIRNLEDFTLNVDNGVGNTTFSFTIQAASRMSSYGSTTSIWLCFAYIMSRFII